MLGFFEKTDADLQEDIESELRFDPSVTNADIGVSVKEGVVTLRGTVPHYFETMNVDNAAQRVSGVKAVADELEVSIKDTYERTDGQIADAAVNAIMWSFSAPKGIKVTVEKGWVTLKGEAEWDYQRTAAKDAVSQLMGVIGVTNSVNIKSKAQPTDIKTRIEDALKRSAEAEGRKIEVKVNGEKVTLSGKVHSLAEKEDARFAAYMAPGIMKVQNDLRIAP